MLLSLLVAMSADAAPPVDLNPALVTFDEPILFLDAAEKSRTTFDEPILFLDLGEAPDAERERPLFVVEGLASFDEPILFHTSDESGDHFDLVLFEDPVISLTVPEDLRLDGPVLQLVDLEGRTVDYTIHELPDLASRR